MTSNYNFLSDNELTDLLKQDCIGAYEVIHRRYYKALYIHAYKKLNNRDEAKDILQDVFASVWSCRNTVNFTAGLKPYLYASVRHAIFNFIKHQKIELRYEESFNNFRLVYEPPQDENFHIKQLMQLINAEVEAMPPKMQLIFKMSRGENISYNQIAQQLDISPLTVKKQVSNSLKILRLKLKNFFLLFFIFTLLLSSF